MLSTSDNRVVHASTGVALQAQRPEASNTPSTRSNGVSSAYNQMTLETAKTQIKGLMEGRTPPGTIRKATEEEAQNVCNFLERVSTLEELKAALKIHPENLVVLTKFQGPWETLLKSVRQSGAASICKVLVL